MSGNDAAPGYWPSPWPGEDGGPTRRSTVFGSIGVSDGTPTVVHRDAVATTMVVLRDAGELFALRHTPGPESIGWVERLDPETLEVVGRSVDLPAGPMWPGGIAAHANGSLHVVFGDHAHRLSPDLQVEASATLPRHRPYNSFVVLPDGVLVTKDFGGVLPGEDPAAWDPANTELVVLDPNDLSIRARLELPEPSIARLSADGSAVYVVGTTTLWRVHWDGAALRIDDTFSARYRTIEGQTYGWDPVVALGAVWFLDNGYGSERFAGTFRGQGINTAPLHLVRVDPQHGSVQLTEICGRPGGVVANPPIVDEARRIVVGFDSGNGVLAAFSVADDGSTTLRWRRDQDHASHMLLAADSGDLLTADHDAATMRDDIVVLDIETGAERARVPSGSPLQSFLFPARGFGTDVYYCSVTTIARLSIG